MQPWLGCLIVQSAFWIRASLFQIHGEEFESLIKQSPRVKSRMRRYRGESEKITIILSYFVLPVEIWSIIDLSVRLGKAHWVVLERRIVSNTRKPPHFKGYTNFASWHTNRDLRYPIKNPISSSELFYGVVRRAFRSSPSKWAWLDVHQRPANKGNSTNRQQ